MLGPLPVQESPVEVSQASSDGGVHVDPVAWSRETIRRIANAGLNTQSLRRELQPLPDSQVVTAADIVARHAHAAALSGKYGDPFGPRYRVKGKQGDPLLVRLERVALNPTVPEESLQSTWADRRSASQFLAAVYASASNCAVRTARPIVNRLWGLASDSVKANAVFLRRHTDAPTASLCIDDETSEKGYECYGSILTYQTAWGRGHDEVAKFVQQGLPLTEMVELCRSLVVLQESFQAFVRFIADSAALLGMKYFSCSMELNDERAPTSRVHLHAFVCMNWADWGTAKFFKIMIEPIKWRFDEQTPHPRPARVGNRANPARALQQGLYYQLSPKVGSLMTASNVTPWKDNAPRRCRHQPPAFPMRPRR